jgi:hypothetical protein
VLQLIFAIYFNELPGKIFVFFFIGALEDRLPAFRCVFRGREDSPAASRKTRPCRRGAKGIPLW